MSIGANFEIGRSSSLVVECLIDQRRRTVLARILDRNSPVSERHLAIAVAASVHELPTTDVTRKDVQLAHVDLRHRHFPKLEAAELIEWSPEDRTVSATTHPVLEDPRLRRLVEEGTPEREEHVSALIDPVRRTVLSVLTERGEPMDRSEVARSVAVRRGDVGDWETFLVPLHHVHLPKLAAAGLVEYDVTEGTVTISASPDIEEAWFDLGSE